MSEGTDAEGADVPRVELLVFRFGGAQFAVEAPKVESVIGWRAPVPLPRERTGIQGVIQDRGRIVSVLRHPSGSGPSTGDDAQRILICPTEHGYVGLPATQARTVSTVVTQGTPVSGEVLDTSERAVTFVDPSEVVVGLLARASGAGAERGGPP